VTPEPESAGAADVPAPGTGGLLPEAEAEAERRDDGLDLARSLTRSTASSSPAARRRPRSKFRAPGRVSGSHPDDRDPQLLDTTLSRLVGDRGWELDLRMQGVFGRWEQLVGAEIAQHCTPESFADAKLVVRTDSTAWATQLRLLAPSLVKRLNQELGHGTVSVIDVLGPHLPTWKKGRLSSRDGRGPRDTYG